MADAMPLDPVVAVAVLVVILTVALNFLSKKNASKGGNAGAGERNYPIILGLATGNPDYRVSQEKALEVAQRAPGCPTVNPVLERIYGNSKIKYRHFCVPDFTSEEEKAELAKKGVPDDEDFYPADGSYKVPVEVRLEKFREKAVPLVKRVCLDAINDAGISVENIHKLIVVSSTGFLGPGLDCALIEELGLSRGVDRSSIGFMGCAAAMNGMRDAMSYAASHPGKNALLCCVELSSPHSTFDDTVNDAILHAIFADGCAATVVTAKPKSEIPRGTLAVVDDHSWLIEGTQDGITLSVNANGISCTLSKHLPRYIAKNMGGYVDSFLAKHELVKDDVDFWAVHPGGRRIIEEAQNGLGLTEEQTADSWAVLENYGNMLSPTVMFVLQRIFARHNEMRQRGEDGYKCGLAFSFSPGVGAEGIMLRQLD